MLATVFIDPIVRSNFIEKYSAPLSKLALKNYQKVGKGILLVETNNSSIKLSTIQKDSVDYEFSVDYISAKSPKLPTKYLTKYLKVLDQYNPQQEMLLGFRSIADSSTWSIIKIQLDFDLLSNKLSCFDYDGVTPSKEYEFNAELVYKFIQTNYCILSALSFLGNSFYNGRKGVVLANIGATIFDIETYLNLKITSSNFAQMQLSFDVDLLASKQLIIDEDIINSIDFSKQTLLVIKYQKSRICKVLGSVQNPPKICAGAVPPEMRSVLNHYFC